MGSSSDVDFLIFELQQSVLESEYKLKQDLLKFRYGRVKASIKPGTSDSPSPSKSVPVAALKSSSTLSENGTSSHPPTVSSTAHSTPSIVPASQHVTHHPVSSTQNTQHIHVSSAEFVPRSSGIPSDSPSRSNSVPVAASKSSSTLSAVISTSSHPPTVSSTAHSTPSRVPVSSQHITHHPVSSTQNTHHIHVSSAEFVPLSSGIQLDKIPSVVFSSIPSVTVCSTQDTAQDFTESDCISLDSVSGLQCVVHVPDHQSQSLHVQGCPCPSDVFPPDCHDNPSNAEPTKFSPNDSQVDILRDSSVSDIVSTGEASVPGHFRDVSFGCSPCSTDVPPPQVLCTTPESVVVSCQKDSEVSTHVLSSNDVMLPSQYRSFDRFYSQFCNTLCIQKTDLFSGVTVCFSTMKSAIVMLTLGFIDSDRRFLKRRRKVGI